MAKDDPGPAKGNYEQFEVVTAARNACHARTPPILTSAIEDICGHHIAEQLKRREWSVFEGEYVHSSGATVEQMIDQIISTRPYMLVPPEKTDEAAECWLSGNITKHGHRRSMLVQLLGNEKTAEAAWRAEAAQFGVTAPGTTQKGVQPATKAEEPTDKSTSNPWSAHFHGDEAARAARIANVIKGQGTAFANKLAKAAGTTIGRPLPLARKAAGF